MHLHCPMGEYWSRQTPRLLHGVSGPPGQAGRDETAATQWCPRPRAAQHLCDCAANLSLPVGPSSVSPEGLWPWEHTPQCYWMLRQATSLRDMNLNLPDRVGRVTYATGHCVWGSGDLGLHRSGLINEPALSFNSLSSRGGGCTALDFSTL